MTIRSSVLIFTLCFFQLGLQAQHSLGFRIGAASAGVKAPDALSALTGRFDKLTAWDIALFSELKIAPNFSIQPELAYAQKGFVIDETRDLNLFDIPLPLGVRSVTQINYVEMPLLAKLSFGHHKVSGFVGIGPNISYALDGKLKARARVILDIPITNTDIDLDQIGYNRFEAGGIITAGVAVDTGNGKFFIDARYKRGFTDTYTVPVVDLEVRNSSFGMNIGYAFKLTGNRY
ncbi:MAG: porin family protein [Bacteroidota bacterium]